MSLERRRDIIMRGKDGTIITIIGIENQANIHYAMPLRTLTYDVLGYIKTNYYDYTLLWRETLGWSHKFSRNVRRFTRGIKKVCS